MVENRKGGIMLSAHAGNWEIAGHYLDRLDTPINIVMFDAEYQNIKEYLESVTGKRKAKVITIKDDMSHIYQINEALSNNELICIHADRLTDPSQKALKLDFMGKPAKFPYNIFKLIVTFRVPVSFVFAFKEGNFHYHFYATPAELYNANDKEAEIQRLSEKYVSGLEEKVKKYPNQWFNYYNFWE
jgi:predicted LPLAT superfamily acyltransferase